MWQLCVSASFAQLKKNKQNNFCYRVLFGNYMPFIFTPAATWSDRSAQDEPSIWNISNEVWREPQRAENQLSEEHLQF